MSDNISHEVQKSGGDAKSGSMLGSMCDALNAMGLEHVALTQVIFPIKYLSFVDD